MTAAEHLHVQTCALDADLFDGTPAAPVRPAVAAAVLLEFDGELIHDAEVRNIPVGDGEHVRPVLCFELASTSVLRHTICAQQIFTEAMRAEAVAAAKTLRKGMRVTVATPPDGMRIKLPHIARVVHMQDQ